MNILICDPIGQDGIDYLKKTEHDVIFLPDITPVELLDKIVDVDALIVRGRTKVTKDVIQRGRNLKVIARSGTGVDTIDCAAAKKKNIIVVNAPGANAESVAEHTLAFMLALARHLIPAVTTLKSGTWAKSDFHGMELKGKTLGIVGFGHIGGRVAELAMAFGMEILVYSHKQPTIGSLVTLSDLLTKSDIITLHIPLSDETRKLLGTKEFASMKKTAFLVNTSRGGVVDEAALIEALDKGIIAGAALDVYAVEPLPSDSPLLAFTNVITTPHVAADSFESENRASLTVAQDIVRVLSGESAIHMVE